jgi:hypothetical protein
VEYVNANILNQTDPNLQTVAQFTLSNPYTNAFNYNQTNNSPTYDNNFMTLSGPFSVNVWQTKYNSFMGAHPDMDTIPSGINTDLDYTNPWANQDFTTYVTNNYSTIANQLTAIFRQIDGPDFQMAGVGFILPCRSVLLFFYLYYKLSKKQEVLVSSFMLNTSEPFIVGAWINCFNAAVNNTNIKTNVLTASGIAATTENWSNIAFVKYISQNFTTLCASLNNSNNLCNVASASYIIPCQSFYDYLWTNYQISLLPASDNAIVLPTAATSQFLNPVS